MIIRTSLLADNHYIRTLILVSATILVKNWKKVALSSICKTGRIMRLTTGGHAFEVTLNCHKLLTWIRFHSVYTNRLNARRNVYKKSERQNLLCKSFKRIFSILPEYGDGNFNLYTALKLCEFTIAWSSFAVIDSEAIGMTPIIR